MLRITVELIPHGRIHKKRTLGVLEISNDGTGSHERGNYTCSFDGKPEGEYRVNDHARNLSFWNLIKKAITEMEYWNR